MNFQRLSVCLLAVGLAIPSAALAQEEQPRILLDLGSAGGGVLGAPNAGLEDEPAAGSEATPQIQLPPPAATSFESGGPQVSPIIPQRDRSADVMPAVSQDWLLPLTPASRPSHMVQIGASQPAPGILRLAGEVASADFNIDLPQDAVIPAELMLTLRSTVNVLTEASAVTISINDATPVVLPLNHLSGFETLRVPTSGLTSGMNRVRLNLRQPHRIYCGPEASFSVWTEIDLPRSGVPINARTLSADAAGLALALRAQAATGQLLPVLVAEDEDAALLRGLTETLGRVLAGQMRIEFRSFYGLESPSLVTVALIASHRSHAELRKGATGGLVLQIEHAGGQLPPLDEFLPQALMPVGNIPALTPGVTTSLAELDQPDIIGNTRYYRHEVPFDLPDDWLLLSNQKGRLTLRYGFAHMLPQGATLLVKINGETIRLLPLDRSGGQMQDPLDIIFSANLLHSGRNGLIFEMMVPGDPPDAICPARRADMLVVTNDSTLLVPPAPAMALAGISTPLSEVGPQEIVVPQDASDRVTLERAALELAAGLTPKAHSPDTSVRLNVIGISDISTIPLGQSEISRHDLQEALVEKASIPASDASITAPESNRSYRLTEEDPQPADRPDDDAGKSDTADPPGSFVFRDWFAGQARRFRSTAFIGSNESLPAWLRTQRGSALLLRPNQNEPGELWLILGPRASVSSVQQGLVRLRDSGLAKGEAAILTAEGSWQVWSGVRPPELRESLKLSNLRSVLGNYASWSPLLFTIGFLGLAVLSAIPAFLFILFTRRRGQL